MSANIAISIQGVGKSYVLYDRPEDRLKHSLLWRFGRHYGRVFWALQNISLEIGRGESFGVIGKNGSGKSTLLQILAGILTPTHGKVLVNGRVSALLELGSGFNPEYTGRENVFLNGSILGIEPAEMRSRFDQIAAFADIGDFIDQPVKLYSSGMFVRLAFAVAAGVDADILLIDEALAVGDIFFRQKCYQRLDALRKKGTTIILVSHGMNEVEQFCDRALLLSNSEAVFLGSAIEAVKRYYLIEQMGLSTSAKMIEPAIDPVGSGDPANQPAPSGMRWPGQEAFLDLSHFQEINNGWAHCTAIALCDENNKPCTLYEQGQTACFYYEFELNQDIQVPIGGVQIQNERALIIHGKTALEYNSQLPTRILRGSRVRFCQKIELQIANGEYTFEVGFSTIHPKIFEQRGQISQSELYAQVIRIGTVTGVGPFMVAMRRHGEPAQLMHHGAANLPGEILIEWNEADCEIKTDD